MYYYMNKLNTQLLGLKSLINKQHKKKLHIDYLINMKALMRMNGLKTYNLASSWDLWQIFIYGFDQLEYYNNGKLMRKWFDKGVGEERKLKRESMQEASRLLVLWRKNLDFRGYNL